MVRVPSRWLGTVVLLVLGAGSACAAGDVARFGPSNPFYRVSRLPFHAPPFDQIRDADYEPAIEAGMARQLAEIAAIANDKAKPTFANTLVAMERSGLLLERAEAAFDGVSSANTDDVLQAAKAALAPKLAAHQDAIYLNAKLFKRIAAVYATRRAGKFDAESLRLIEVTYDQFVRSGANLSTTDQAALQELNEAESVLSTRFTSQLLAATRDAAYATPSSAALAGLDEATLAGAARAARDRKLDGYVLVLQNTTVQPVLAALDVRATRRGVFDSSWNRSERGDANDTRATLARLAQVRAQRAALLGFPNHAAWKLGDQMAGTPRAALDFMAALVPSATAKADRERAEIQQYMDSQRAGFAVEAWDWPYYGAQVRKSSYQVDDSRIKPYFELGRVLEDGVFYAATRLYGITFEERRDIPVYQSDVRVFEVRDAQGKALALFYCDYFKRDNKNGGAWMSSFVGQSQLLGTLPVVYNVANFPKPAAGEPALIGIDDVLTMFHEFGHALHGMFADTRYPSLSGTATARDFVEFPSQFNEHWALYPAVFNHFARHYKSGDLIPRGTLEQIARAQNAGEGYALTELLAAAELDLQWHLLGANAPLQDPDDFEKRALQRMHLDIEAIPPRYRSSYFNHIWGGGYSAGYYAYLWTQMLDDDAFQGFEEQGGLTRENGDRFRRMVLSRGNTQNLADLYIAWRGKPPTIDAMRKYRGLDAASPPTPP